MILIEAMKQHKDLLRKAEDLRGKIRKHCAYLSYETPPYTSQEEQKAQVASWLQAHTDVLKEIARLRLAIQRTNTVTPVTIPLGDTLVTKTISEWIVRRQVTAALDREAWARLDDKGLKEGQIRTSDGEAMEVKIIRCYDPVLRDNKVEQFASEPALIDAKLEIINATTPLIETDEAFTQAVQALSA